MADTVPYILASLAVVGCWWLGLGRLGVFTADDVRSWRRLAALRGYALPQTRIEKAVRRSHSLQRLQMELDLDRLLAMANRAETPLAFLGRSVGVGFLGFGAALLIDAIGRAALGDWPFSPWLSLALGVAVVPANVIDLRAAARRNSEAMGRTLGDLLTQLAVITDTRGLRVHDAVRLLSRCSQDGRLANLIDAGGYDRLVHDGFRSSTELYGRIATSYGVPLFAELADVIATTNVGVPEREAFTRLALTVYERRLSEARVRSARAKVLVTLPVAAMLIPLLLLIAAPTFQAISAGLHGG
jgi:hypothetical protein